MLVSEVVNSKSIALAATEDASNKIPFLGLNWFPEDSKAGIDLAWIKRNNGLPVSLAPSNFDALPTIRAREGLAKEKTQMAFFREEMFISETDAQEIDRVKDADDPYLASAVKSIYDDTNTLLAGARVVPERMRMQLLATVNGHPMIGIESDGVKYAYDYDPNGEYASTHYKKLTSTAMWSDTTNSTPITDLNNARKALKKLGKEPKYVLMNSNTFEYLIDNAQVRNSILAQNITASIEVDDETVVSVIKKRTKLTIVIYDKMYKDEAGNEKYFYPDNKVTLLPDYNLGKTWFGTTPEERTGRQKDDVDVTIFDKGIAVAVVEVYGPPAKTKTIASEVVLPSYEEMDATYVIDVAESNF